MSGGRLSGGLKSYDPWGYSLGLDSWGWGLGVGDWGCSLGA